MYKKNRRQEVVGQIPFADLAMAAMAPIAILMFVFLVMGAKSFNTCKSLSEQEIANKIKELNQLIEAKKDSGELIEGLTQRIHSITCANGQISAAPATEYGTQDSMFEQFFNFAFGDDEKVDKKLCSKSVQAILEGSVLGETYDPEQLAELFDEQLEKTLANLSDTCSVCQPLSPQKIEDAVANLNQKIEKEGIENMMLPGLTARMDDIACSRSGGLLPPGDTNTSNAKQALLKNVLDLTFGYENLCAADAHTILSRSRLGEEYNPEQLLTRFDQLLKDSIARLNETCAICKPLTDEELAVRVQELNDLIAAQGVEGDLFAGMSKRLTAINCDAQGGLFLAPGDPAVENKRALFNHLLELGFGSAHLCAGDVQAILRQSNLSDQYRPERILHMLDEAVQNALTKINQACSVCKPLSEEEISARIEHINEQIEMQPQEQNLLQSMTQRLQAIECGNDGLIITLAKETTATQKTFFDYLQESDLGDDRLCDRDIYEILRRTKLGEQYNPAELDKNLNQTVNRLNTCLSPEKLTSKEVLVEFKPCQTVPLSLYTKKPIKPDEITEVVLKDIIATLKTHPEYNRIDIFGHTDERPISKGGCRSNGAQNNRELSSLRVHAYLDLIEKALEDNKELKPYDALYQSWKSGKLKIYAIGVGEREPKDGNLKDYAANRRIELRYAREIRR